MNLTNLKAFKEAKEKARTQEIERLEVEQAMDELETAKFEMAVKEDMREGKLLPAMVLCIPCGSRYYGAVDKHADFFRLTCVQCGEANSFASIVPDGIIVDEEIKGFQDLTPEGI